MKPKKITVLIFVITLLFSSTAMAVNLADITIQNATFVEKFKYSIDIYAISTGDTDFGVGASSIALEFNDTVLSYDTLANQNALFHNNSNYGVMNIEENLGGVANRMALTITPTSGTGATLPATDTRLATIIFDIVPAYYDTEKSGIRAITGGGTSMASLPDTGLVGLDWAALVDFADNSMICLPAISGTPGTTAEVGILYDFTPTTVDVCNTIPDVGDLTFSIANKPLWASYDGGLGATGQLSGTPVFGDVAVYSDIVITVTDGYGDAADLAAFAIDVVCPPPPSISGTPATSVVSGSAYDFTPAVTDGCGALTFSITNPPTWASFSFDTGTGQMTGTPTLADVGTTTGVLITVEDENSSTDSLAAFDLAVTPSCAPPTISGTPDDEVMVGNTYSFTPTVSNGCAPLAFSIANKPSWATFDVNTGELSGTPAAVDEGSYGGIVITVTDALSDSDSLAAFDILVCSLPAISGAPVTSITAGNSYDFTPSVAGGCGTLTFSITNPPAWASFSFDTGTGRMTGAPTMADLGTTTGVGITVKDQNGNVDTLTAFDIAVTPSCTSPSIAGTPATTVAVGNLYSFTPTVSNGCAPLGFSITNQPSWATFDTATGELSGTPAAGQEGSYGGIVITVTDDLGAIDSLTAFNIEVTATGGGGGGGGGCFISNLLAP